MACRYHLYLSVNRWTGAITFHHPGIEPHEMKHSCALDIADAGETSSYKIGAAIGLSHTSAQNIVKKALNKLERSEILQELHQ